MIDLSNKAKMKDIYPFIKESIKDGGQFALYPSGTSMLPTIKPGEDCVILVEAEPLRKHDLVLFIRKGGTFVLHRIIGEKNGEYIIMGDNQTWTEKILPSQIVAKVSEIRKKNGDVLTFTQFSSFSTLTSLFISKFFRRVKGRLCRIIRGNKGNK